MKSIEEVVYPGQRVGVFDGSCVKLSKIDANAQATVLFPHHYHMRSPRTVGQADDVAGQHLLDLRHLLPSNSRVLSSVGLAEWGFVCFDRVLQQRITPKIVFPLAEDIAELQEKVVQLLLLEWREMLGHGRLTRWTRTGGCGRRISHRHNLEDANTLPRVEVERLRPVVVDDNPEFRTTGERRNACHKRRQRVSGTE